MELLHKEMDGAMQKRKHRIRHAVSQKDTSMQWDILAAGVEEGVIDFFKLEGKEATKMKGRSKVTFSHKTKRLLKGLEEDDENADLVTRATWLRTPAGQHTGLANKLINVARNMKTKTSDALKTIEADGQSKNDQSLQRTRNKM